MKNYITQNAFLTQLKKHLYLFCVCLFAFSFYSISLRAQTVSAAFPSLAGQLVKFGTFQGLRSYTLDSVKADAKGEFSFRFNTEKPAIGYLITAENKPYFLILDKEEKIKLKGEYLSAPATITVEEGKQNKIFAEFAAAHPKREQALTAWDYLEKIYRNDSFFSQQQKPAKAIREEKERIKKEEEDFLKKLDLRSYVAWYLPVRRLVSSVSTVAQYRAQEIPETIIAFRKLDYTDERLYRSGLFKDAIESLFWLLENSGRSLDSVFIEMKISIDVLLSQISRDEKKMNEITDYLFDLLERQSLFNASEYLALKVLNEVSCTLNSDLAKQLETYRAMKKGNTAPDFNFVGDVLAPGFAGQQQPQKLSDLKSRYTVVAFGASWCEKCKQEIPEMAGMYAKWKAQGVEVVFVSLDENKTAFINFASALPFISLCDYRKWKTAAAEAYYVFGTPTLFLLDENRKIVLRPTSLKQMDAWVDWFLVKGNR